MRTTELIGKEATITDKNSIYYGEWGIIRHFDGDRFHIAMWNGNEEMVFDRNEFKIRRRTDG